MAKNTLTCLITGKSFTFSKDYFEKKVKDFTDEETLRKYFITSKAKSLLARGYSVQEIRNILSVEDDNLLPVDCQEIKSLVSFHQTTANSESKRQQSSAVFSNNKTDPDVAVFINNIKNLNS